MDWLRKEREVLIMKYVNNFFDWAVGVYKEFCNDSDKIESRVDTTTGITIVYDLRTGESAFSKCPKGEKFNEDIGIAVAYTRLKGGEVPRVLQKTLLKNLVASDEFALPSSSKSTFRIVGVNPLRLTEIITVNTHYGVITRFPDDTVVYKIN